MGGKSLVCLEDCEGEWQRTVYCVHGRVERVKKDNAECVWKEIVMAVVGDSYRDSSVIEVNGFVLLINKASALLLCGLGRICTLMILLSISWVLHHMLELSLNRFIIADQCFCNLEARITQHRIY